MSDTLRVQRERAEARRNRRIAVGLIIAALLIDVFGWFVFSAVPPVRAFRSGGHTASYWRAYQPVVTFEFNFSLSAAGSFSVNNPIHVHVVVYGVNISNFIDHYDGISFTQGFTPDSISDLSKNPVIKIIYLKDASGGKYIGDGDVVWLAEGGTWFYVVPTSAPTKRLAVNYPDVQVGPPLLTVGSVTDTLNVQGNVATQRLTWILVGFSVLMLQPILQAVRRIR